MPKTCDCSGEYGPCQAHSEVLAQREGASTRTADELLSVFVHDCLAIDPDCLSPQGRAWLTEADAAIERGRDAYSGVAWIADEDEQAREDLHTLAHQVEAHMADLWIAWEDGYVIARITGGPLAPNGMEAE